jgi:hypothetical protein
MPDCREDPALKTLASSGEAAQSEGAICVRRISKAREYRIGIGIA